MKRISALLLTFALFVAQLPVKALTLEDIRQQIPSYSAQLGIPIILPQADKAPVLRLMESSALPKLSEPAGAYSEVIPGSYGASYNDPVWRHFGQSDMRYNLPKGQEFEWKAVSPPWDDSKAYPENNPFTLGEAVSFFQSHVAKATGGSVQTDLFAFDLINSGQRGRATVFGYEILPPYGVGAYQLEIRQVIDGWMVMDSIHNHLADDGFKGNRPPSLLRQAPSRIASPESYTIAFHFLEVEQVLAEDIPLCPLDTVTAAYERIKNAGQILRMSELRLGYVLFFDPAQSNRAIAFPCWLLKCEYLRKPQRSKNAPADMSVEDSPCYAQLLVDANSGNLIGPRITREQDARAPAWNK